MFLFLFDSFDHWCYFFLLFCLYDIALLQMVLESNGVSIWQMAVALSKSDDGETNGVHIENGFSTRFLNGFDDHEDSESDEDSDSSEVLKQSILEGPRVAVGFDDGCVRIYTISDANEFIYLKSLTRVTG